MIYLVDSISISDSRKPGYEQLRDKLESLLHAIRLRDPHYEGHIERACFYALEFGRLQRLSEKEIHQLYLGAFFHDIGKVLVPAEIINKRGPLDSQERNIMMTHAELGRKICRGLGPFEEIANLVGSHHERPNGTGYPKGLKGEEISYLSRILAIIEIYDALRSERSYKMAFSIEESLDILYQNGSDGNLDSIIVHEFAKFALNIQKDAHLALSPQLKKQKI